MRGIDPWLKLRQRIKLLVVDFEVLVEQIQILSKYKRILKVHETVPTGIFNIPIFSARLIAPQELLQQQSMRHESM